MYDNNKEKRHSIEFNFPFFICQTKVELDCVKDGVFQALTF